MALVPYSDSESDTTSSSSADRDDAFRRPPRKKPRPDTRSTKEPSGLPPLPALFHDLYASSARASVRDDPSLHGGRKRVIPHIEGNWPTHIYLEWYPSREARSVLNEFIIQTQQNTTTAAAAEDPERATIHSLLESDLGVQLPLHISLSRPAVLRTHERASFVETLQAALSNSYIQPFEIAIDKLDWVSNHEKTRWFLVLRVHRPESDSLNNLLQLSNRTLATYGQPPLYEAPAAPAVAAAAGRRRSSRRQPSSLGGPGEREEGEVEDRSHCFHLSIAWSLSEPRPADKERISQIELAKLRDIDRVVHFTCVKAKIGNAVTSIPLVGKVLDERGFGVR